MMDFDEYVNRISVIKEDSMAALRRCFEPSLLNKGDYFVREGEYAKQIGFLKKGIVRAFFLSEEGTEYNKQFFVAPSIIGAYSALLTKIPNEIAQQALSDCEVLVANFADVENLYDDFHDIERLGRKLAEYYFLEKEQKEIEMALLDADKRYLLLRERFPSIESLVPQYQVASYLGISATQLSRIRRKLADQ